MHDKIEHVQKKVDATSIKANEIEREAAPASSDARDALHRTSKIENKMTNVVKNTESLEQRV